MKNASESVIILGVIITRKGDVHMINIYKTSEVNRLEKVDYADAGCWIAVTEPSSQEIKTLIDQYGLDTGTLSNPLLMTKKHHELNEKTTRHL